MPSPFDSIDFNSLSASDLKELVRRAEAATTIAAQRAKAEAKTEILAVLSKHSLSPTDLAEMFGISMLKTGPSSRKKPAPKYFNPADPSVTWTGRGKTPKWCTPKLMAEQDAARS